MIQFEKVNIEYLVAVIFLGTALIVGIVYGEKELAINIASGIIGYIGGRGVGYAMSRANSQQTPQDPPQARQEPQNTPKAKEGEPHGESKHRQDGL